MSQSGGHSAWANSISHIEISTKDDTIFRSDRRFNRLWDGHWANFYGRPEEATFFFFVVLVIVLKDVGCINQNCYVALWIRPLLHSPFFLFFLHLFVLLFNLCRRSELALDQSPAFSFNSRSTNRVVHCPLLRIAEYIVDLLQAIKHRLCGELQLRIGVFIRVKTLAEKLVSIANFLSGCLVKYMNQLCSNKQLNKEGTYRFGDIKEGVVVIVATVTWQIILRHFTVPEKQVKGLFLFSPPQQLI